ncbi:MAG: chemotaxis protein CheW [Paracoccaceae bacterium]
MTTALAEPQAETQHVQNREFVAFRTADQDFCVDIQTVREIRGWTKITILPHAPDYVLGVINLRGSVVPILDFSARLGLPTLEHEARNVIIIAVVNTQVVGLLVEAVSDIIGVDPDHIQPTPDVASDTTKAFVAGVIAIEDRMLRLIDLERVLPGPDREDR